MNNPIIDELEKNYLGKDLPSLNAGDTVKVFVKIVEGNKERIQAFEGIVTEIKGSGVSRTFTVRKISQGVGVERIFPVNSPKIKEVAIVRKGMVRRAKLHYLRDLKSQPKIKERRDNVSNKAA